MAKGQGLIGNFKGKLGNTVGYSLKDSNNKQTQGIRVYQPVVRNPKTYAQAEQRAKLAPINATYRALKMVIDRGQEGKAYGNKSRLAWLSAALKAFNGGWTEKGKSIIDPAMVLITKGSLSCPFTLQSGFTSFPIVVAGVTIAGTTKMGQLSTAILAAYPSIQNGDQITFINMEAHNGVMSSSVFSFEIDTESTENIPGDITVSDGSISVFGDAEHHLAGTIVLSREGSNGAHLRSTSKLVDGEDFDSNCMTDEYKEAAIESYMSQGANTDWAEESLMG